MRVRATHLQVAQHCTGSPALQRETPQEPLVDDAVRLGTIGHAYLEIALSVGWGVAAAWLAGVPEVEAQLPELTGPDFQRWIVEDVLDRRRGKAEVPALWNTRRGVVSMRLDWVAEDHASEEGVELVVDWKFGRGQRYHLPPIGEDLQMVAYGLLAYQVAGSAIGAQATVKRVLVGERRVDTLTVTRDNAEALQDWLLSILEDVAANPDRRTPGLWCSSCWARHACPERLSLVEPVSVALALPDVPLSLSPVQASQWAVAREALRDRMDALDAALRAYVEAGGEVRDREQGRKMVLNRYRKDRLVVTGWELMQALGDAVGAAGGEALTSSKSRVMDAMKAAGLDRAARDAVWESWRARGLVESEDVATLRWAKDRRVIDG